MTGAKSLRLYVTAQDPFLFTSSSVLDPESQTERASPRIARSSLAGASVSDHDDLHCLQDSFHDP